MNKRQYEKYLKKKKEKEVRRNEADFAKSIELANTRFQRIVSLQLDFNKCTTELYKAIPKYSTNIPAVREFEIVMGKKEHPKDNDPLIKMEMNDYNFPTFTARCIKEDMSCIRDMLILNSLKNNTEQNNLEEQKSEHTYLPMSRISLSSSILGVKEIIKII